MNWRTIINFRFSTEVKYITCGILFIVRIFAILFRFLSVSCLPGLCFFFAMFSRGSRANGTCSWINSSIDVISLWWGMPVLDSTLYNKVCQWLPTCPGSPDFSIEITKVLFKLSKNNHSGNTTVPSILYFIQIYR